MISVISCSIDANRARWIEAHFRALLGAEPHELIAIRNARSLAEGYNRAVDLASGEILIFSHDDVEFLDPVSWLPRLKSHLSRFDLVGLAGTTRLVAPAWAQAGPPYTFGQVAELDGKTEPFRVLICGIPGRAVPQIQALDGLFFAVQRHVLDQVRFDEVTFDGFHGYDIDFTYSAYRAGFRLAVATDLPVLHASQGNFDARWEIYARRFMDKHGPHLPRSRRRPFQHALVSAQTKEELLEIMAHPHATD